MEKIDKIFEFLRVEDNICNFGFGDGSGFGSSDGYGFGSGYGSGDGDGSGSGDGYGDGYGSGDVDGSGYGDGDGDGFGYGSGYGDGSGDGDGDGCGYGSGYGDGSGCGDGLRLKTLNNKQVFYIDNVPTIILSIHNNIAKCKIIDESDFSTTDCYVAKVGNCFAHEKDIRTAVESARRKMYSQMDIEQKIEEFVSKFKKDKEYKGQEFFDWHNILTGSCLMGRKNFVSKHNIDLDKNYTVNYFISICEDDFGGSVIKRLKEYYL